MGRSTTIGRRGEPPVLKRAGISSSEKLVFRNPESNTAPMQSRGCHGQRLTLCQCSCAVVLTSFCSGWRRTSGFDPHASWTWSFGREVMRPTDCGERMNRWLKVRHAIAHGHDDLPDVGMLSKFSSGERSLHRANAEACMLFFRRITECTSDVIEAYFAGV